MRIILVRHAKVTDYVTHGDSRARLDPAHAHLSIKCGEFLKDYFNKTAIKKWPLVWTSQFLRSQQTWTGIKDGIGDLFNNKAIWHIDPRLNEQSFGLLPYMDQLKNSSNGDVAKAAQEFSKILYQADAFNNKTFMGESPKETLESVQNFLDGSFWRDVNDGQDDFLIISHGAVMKAFIMNYFHLYDLDTWKQLQTPGNCDVYVIEGKPKDWTVKKVYDGEKAQSLLDNPMNPIEGIMRPNQKPPPPIILPE